MDEDRPSAVDAVAALAEPTRRRVYDHVVRQVAAVGRDDVAEALTLPRATAAFHLDRLVAEGLLDVHFERRSGRTGPGAGRPAKLYRRAACSLSVSLPERRYDLAGELLAAALEEAERSGERPGVVLDRRAHERGRELAAAAGGPAGRETVLRVLEDHGFEPRSEGDTVTLGNCPFHSLAQQHTELVCGMNLRLLDGLLDGAGGGVGAPFTARLSPEPGRCCVRLEPATTG
ncbi:Predicted transcriptional regulator, ArsR family [Blastococcus aggregatus]|uniref:Predicted transcriptional regulator, ArsR family n=1 Tax=Blastococcus aggregatus TaxID=38502 RepID=A0A285V9Q0_9ACTN|nr:helix-turn-helix domain-containing protein [Blastococcus aggregatus]SOC50845.1 Predicted transcriptional regulator, ArsR family [Blastococcus aggregatus]